MNNSRKREYSKEVSIQLKRAVVNKNILIKNIYKEYETYFKIVRKSIFSSVEKGIFSLYEDLSINDKSLNISALTTSLNQNISFLIDSKLPLLTIEQLKLENFNDSKKKLVKEDVSKKLKKLKEYQVVNSDNENELINLESLEFHCNNTSNIYEYYESPSEDILSSLNLDECHHLNYFPKQNTFNNFKFNNSIISSLELKETNEKKINHSEELNYKVNDDFISRNNLNLFEIIDKAFINLLLKLSYDINSELFKISLIKKLLSLETYKSLLDNTYFIKYPYPFVLRYDFKNNFYDKNSMGSHINLINISNVELEYYNLDLSICRNRINELKNRFRILNKKYRYWKKKELTFSNPF